MAKQIQFRRGTTAQHSSFTGLVGEVTVDTDKKVLVVHDGATAGGNPMPTYLAYSGLFNKDNKTTVAFVKTGAGSATTSTRLVVEINGSVYVYASLTSIFMPTLTAGTDYAIYACADGTVRADSSFSYPSGYSTTTSRQIGGFHYAPGSNATGTSGGNTMPQINEYSFWDIKFRPSSSDARGRTLVAGKFWSAIYLGGVDHVTNGISKYNVTIADGSSPPKIPTQFGGNGSSAYGSLNWWEAGEVCIANGMRMPTYSEFAALAYGTTEATSVGSDPGVTSWDAARVSRWGVNQASGVMWIWGDEFGGGAAGSSWTANTGGRGSTYQMENAVILGGNWSETSNAGSRCSFWANSPTNSFNSLGLRGVCDHLVLA